MGRTRPLWGKLLWKELRALDPPTVSIPICASYRWATLGKDLAAPSCQYTIPIYLRSSSPASKRHVRKIASVWRSICCSRLRSSLVIGSTVGRPNRAAISLELTVSLPRQRSSHPRAAVAVRPKQPAISFLSPLRTGLSKPHRVLEASPSQFLRLLERALRTHFRSHTSDLLCSRVPLRSNTAPARARDHHQSDRHRTRRIDYDFAAWRHGAGFRS